MKALILAGGRGKRLNEISEKHNKCMLPLRGAPVIERSLRNVVAAGVAEIVIVVGYKVEAIINAYGNSYAGLPVRYVIQSEQRGLVHAIECSRDALGDSDFCLCLGDEIMSGARHAQMVSQFGSADLFGICGTVIVQDLRRIGKTYAIFQDEGGRVYRLIEKPRKPPNNVMGTGNCVFRNGLLDYIDLTPINQSRGERELPDLIQCAIDDGHIVKSFEICDEYFNVNSAEDLREAETRLRELGE
jgi:dTDP-glucose pyrophosphorylase